ncbi:hypothetical protein [Nocardia blacklockiae]|uniref:hypothetical protein n=1 Tax=Nocardia blacklockiae TaxID=480036 RepID=UPI001895DB72|nr:hypothetical protein [Nocardia blacklockiae]MBF6174061.1 hypothetical protein [Nocardia blacklockiae]
MDEQQQDSPFVRSMSTRVARRATAYSHAVDRFLAGTATESPRPDEQQLLDLFTAHVESVVARYDPPGIRRNSDSLVFRRLYAESRQPRTPRLPRGGRVVTPELLAALLAAEVEYRGPLRLSRAQTRNLAEIYERLGDTLTTVLPAHAALAFRRAASLYRQDEDTDGEDRCNLELARARRRAQPVRWRRIASLFPDLLCGYGYRPFRMLIWMALQLLFFTAVVRLLSTQATMTIVYECLTNYLNPLGPDDTAGLQGAKRLVFVVEAYTGLLTTSVFFALLVRRWFRL